MSTQKAAPKKSAQKPAPAKKPAAPVKASAAQKPAAPAKKAPAKAAPAKKAAAKKPAKQLTSREAMLARVESVRLIQRGQGNFDCFATAVQGYCDQGGCSYHAECLSVSQLMFGL